MRIGVFTLHGCINYGSYWQARCLVEGLRARGHDAVLLDHRSPTALSAELRSAFQPLLPVRTPRAGLPALGRKVRAFADAIAGLPLSPPFPLDRPAEAGAYDAIVVGSDEVWNFRHPWYGGMPAFFGDGVRAGRLVSYAASFGSHPATDGLDAHWAGLLGRFDAVSVRDANSRAIVSAALGRDPPLVLDPCLQFRARLPAAEGQSGPDGGYALLYGHGLPGWFAAAIRRWADRTATRLVSIGYASDIADEQRIAAGPIEFARLAAGAGAIITNFFHGVVFALAHAKPFVTCTSPYRQLKIEGLVGSLGAGGRLIDRDMPEGAIVHLLAAPLEPAIGQRIAAMRAQSDRYLDGALG